MKNILRRNEVAVLRVNVGIELLMSNLNVYVFG